jgi:AraC-like DNA-binding protein
MSVAVESYFRTQASPKLLKTLFMATAAPLLIRSIAEYHRIMNLPKPLHPLLSVIRFEDIKATGDYAGGSVLYGFYCVALKKDFKAKMKYGQQVYDFDEGVLAFMAPGQVVKIEGSYPQAFQHTGWLLLFHPDFLWNTPLAKKIKGYDYFSYELTEALHLSEGEEKRLGHIFEQLHAEYHSPIDRYTDELIGVQIESLLVYSERFYQRQFVTRKRINHSILERFESYLDAYFQDEELVLKGLPTVQQISAHLNLSPSYLSRLLKTLTGQSTQQFVQDKLVALAKQQLSTTDLRVSEIAYALGFEHPQSFSKLFKRKTKLSPLVFRESFG